MYDGINWTSYQVADGLPMNTHCRIRIDPDGVVWSLAHAPEIFVSYLSADKWITLPIPEHTNHIINFSSFEVARIHNRITILIGTIKNGLYRYTDNHWQHYTIQNGLPDDKVNGLCVVHDKVYIATGNGICILDGDALDNQFPTTPKLPTMNILGVRSESMHNDRQQQRIWLAGQNWIGFVENGTFTQLAAIVSSILIPEYQFWILQPDGNGGLFYGNIHDIFYVKSTSAHPEHFGRSSGLISEGATSFFIDRERNFWISSLRGVSKIISMRFANYNKNSGLLSNEVTAIAEMKSGELVFGHGNGLTFYNGKQFRTRPFDLVNNISELQTRVLDLSVDSYNNLWIAASSLGLGKLSARGSLRWYTQADGLKDRVTSVLIDMKNTIWVTDRKNLYRVINGCAKHIVDLDSLQGSQGNTFSIMRKLFSSPDSAVFIATTNNGVFKYKNNSWKHYYTNHIPPANNVFAVHLDTQGRTWVGTLAGLYFIAGDSLVKFETNTFNIDRPIYVIVEHPVNTFWFGTDNGAMRWDGTSSKWYNVHNGFFGQEVNRSGGFVDNQGRLWFGTDLGASYYRGKFDYSINDIPEPLTGLLSLQVAGKNLALDSCVVLAYDENNCTFHFKAVSFINEDAIQYRVKLDGFDDDWITGRALSTHQIRYTNLPAGSYHFKFQSQNVLGAWSTIKTSAEIIIEKPFWEMWWFYLILSLIMIGIISSSYLVRISILKQERRLQQEFSKRLLEEVEKGRKRIAGGLHDSLGQNLLIIKNQIQQYIQAITHNTATPEDLAEISAIVSESIQEVRQISYDLHPHQLDRLGLTKAIRALGDRIHAISSCNIQMDVGNIDEIANADQAIYIFRIVQEGLNNIVKHAHATAAAIVIKKLSAHIEIVIRDNGIGFRTSDVERILSETSGFGISGMKERVKILNGQFKIENNNSDTGSGVVITIRLPIQKSNPAKGINA